MADQNKVDANPTKSFFVRMIPRDISLEDCILDLIDNSVDGAWELEGGQPMSLGDNVDLSSYAINIQIEDDRFVISDNCGGITFNDAVEYAFTFGRKEQVHDEPYSIGVYGIGMKRAVFKIGKKINIRSTYDKRGDEGSFIVPIEVQKWLEDDTKDWDFDIAEDKPLDHTGVEITITDLPENVATSFSNPAFVQNLRRMLARDYALHLNRGLAINLNGEWISGWQISLQVGGDISPMRVEYEDAVGDEVVNVEIFAGMVASPPEDVSPSEDIRGEKQYGWYIVCNGRIVLAADKTELSGWGSDGWPYWHQQYAGFIGIVMFNSSKTELLPLTTTKRSVDASSEVFRRARLRMRDASRDWINYTNTRKQSLSEAKKVEAIPKPQLIF